jgi:signal peptidase I
MQDENAPAELTWTSPRVRLRVLFIAFLFAFLCYGFFNWVLWPVKVSGTSMLPNYQDGSRHFINKLAYWSAKPQRGDVVGVQAEHGDTYIKRIIGLPGEHLTFAGGEVAINDVPLREPYIETKVPWPVKPIILGTNDYFVMGDNRAVSVLGAVSSERIIGKVVH